MDVNKLPRWAQQDISALRDRAENAERRLIETLESGETSNVRIRRGYNEESINLPHSSCIEFVLGGDLEDSIHVRVLDGRIELRGVSRGVTRLDVRPEVANVISVGLVR